MSDDLRTRIATALCENDGLNRLSIGYGALWGSYLEAADSVLAVVEPELERLSREVTSSKAAHQAVWELHQQRGTQIFELRGECGRLRDDRDHWETEAGNQNQEAEKLRDLLRVEHERANAAVEREEAAEQHVEELHSYAAKIERERDNYKRAYELKPATMRLEGPGAEALADRLIDVDDLRTTIVSQAREIARLKGESA
ncbi:hypothetical protein [Streptomyces sp. NBC_01212]|uniref:hypothetical protein n=1 Tax=Streptomyces sp. NBC_01212 TaxID=2903775 RepID=UPI002E103190|nr:hypothetical protein OG722_05095 [Streptomyces sp. NBC_01212]